MVVSLRREEEARDKMEKSLNLARGRGLGSLITFWNTAGGDSSWLVLQGEGYIEHFLAWCRSYCTTSS
jgi:hypothetical protein